MSGAGQQLPLFEFRLNYNQKISHDVPTRGGICFNITTVTNLHYTGNSNKRALLYSLSSSNEDGKIQDSNVFMENNTLTIKLHKVSLYQWDTVKYM